MVNQSKHSTIEIGLLFPMNLRGLPLLAAQDQVRLIRYC